MRRVVDDRRKLAREGLNVINYERLYEFRFQGVDPVARQRVWNVIAGDIHRKMRHPRVVLDVAGGTGEFIRAVPAEERWMVDRTEFAENLGDVTLIVGDVAEVELPTGYFDGIFMSNLLEHLPTQDAVADLLQTLRSCLRPGGVLAVMGPNFRYCAKEYFDCADHVLALTHVSVEEHLYAAGFNPLAVVKRYLPYSFRGLLPPSPKLTSVYLRTPMLQAVLGKQFLITAEVA